MNIIGQPIKHRAFGPRIVTAITDGIVTVCFQESEKKFVYPDAFKDFLTLKDQKTQQSIAKLIEDNTAVIQQRNQQEQVESDRRRKILNFKVKANSHAVFNILPEQVEQACKTYTVSTGTYCSGCSKGQPRIAERMKPNSVCLLTACADGQPEKERKVIGAFMVRENFFGEDVHDGIIEGHPQHRLLVPSGYQMLFWKYINNTLPRWGNTSFKYCSGDAMNQILSKLVVLLETTPQKETGINFYRYFCKMNLLRPLVQLEAENNQR